ncbi:ABC transporter permease [Kyrpidia spormannii]|uniref:Molybdate ABC transporter permease subunit n=2 Tax=Kyrpidia spormannii TaxID=2055160 RepID=A0ACA8Z8P0_9BACL|nr:ABC transporter permease [Kyrpidia spormannii]CAB3392172.1 Molybdate ABC transporter permease subunit [Kyrpidia spormannii]CAB3393094.1 Molybdenum transport system permease [Kyrpidia spormannii]
MKFSPFMSSGSASQGPDSQLRASPDGGEKRRWNPQLIFSLTAVQSSFGLVLVLFLFLPVLSLFLSVTPSRFVSALGQEVVRDALGLSFRTSVIALFLVVLFGTPLAHRLATGRKFFGQAIVEALLQLPWITPPAVAGLALLMAFGREGLVGRMLADWGIALPFTTAAVVVAQAFEGSAFYVQSARQAFTGVDRQLAEVSRTLGAGPWRTWLRLELPMALPGLVAGAAMAWARALGEFGATMLFAGNMQGLTQTMPLAIYTVMEKDMDAAVAMAIVLVIVGFGLLWMLFRLGQRMA